MYTSYIGKKFLELYNLKTDTQVSAKVFFDETFFPLFFNHSSHLLHVGNSPFFQKPTENEIKLSGSKSLAQYNKLKKKIEAKEYSGATYVGYAAEDIQATTSAQLSNINPNIDQEEIYSSWIGEAFGIGVNGGIVMLIDEPEILWTLFEGWQVYRKVLKETPELKDKQIETWNGNWLVHRLNSTVDLQDDMDRFPLETANVQGNIAIPTILWSKVLFTMSLKFPNSIKTAYLYTLSQTNTTLGFTNFNLYEIHNMYDIRDKYFLDFKSTVLSDKDILKLEPFYNIKNAFKLGYVGIKALEPKHLREFLPKGTYLYSQGKDIKLYDEKNTTIYFLTKLWIIAMLNKKELLELADEFAKNLHTFSATKSADSERGKTGKARTITELFESTSVKQFLERLTELIKENPGSSELFKRIEIEIISMPRDNFPLFLTLIKFEYTRLTYSQEK